MCINATVSRSQPNIKKYCSPFSGNDVVLGPALSVTHERTLDGIPIEQAICKKKLRPGSGFLSVAITTDGPTRVLQISDSKNKASFQCYKASQGMTVLIIFSQIGMKTIVSSF